MAEGVHKITLDFENEISKYTGAKYVVAVDNMSNALFLCLYYESKVKNNTSDVIKIPCRTYPSVACEIIHAGLKVDFYDVDGEKIKGAYQLLGSKVWDSALRFTHNMYLPNTHMCLSFTGPYKHLKLGKGGAILTDDYEAYKWFKKARFSGRDECSYLVDDFDNNPVIGWNFYMMPEIAARGILLMSDFYQNGVAKINEDLELSYPDLSKFKIWKS